MNAQAKRGDRERWGESSWAGMNAEGRSSELKRRAARGKKKKCWSASKTASEPAAAKRWSRPGLGADPATVVAVRKCRTPPRPKTSKVGPTVYGSNAAPAVREPIPRKAEQCRFKPRFLRLRRHDHHDGIRGHQWFCGFSPLCSKAAIWHLAAIHLC
jgi:hypothetical protein